MSVEDSESRRFELTFGWVFVRPILAQDLPRNSFFRFFFKVFFFFSKICAHSERYRNLLAGIFENGTFFGNIAFPLSPVLLRTLRIFDSCRTGTCTIICRTATTYHNNIPSTWYTLTYCLNILLNTGTTDTLRIPYFIDPRNRHRSKMSHLSY